MPLNPNIILSGQAPQIQNPLEAMQTIAQLQGVREQTEARRLAADEARQKAKDAAAVRQILTETGGDMDLALPRLRGVVPKLALEMETEIQQARKEKSLAAKSDIDARVAGVNFGANIASMAVQNPARIPALRTYLQGISAEVEPLLPESDDPAEWQEFHNLLLSGKDRIELAQKNLDHFLKGEYHQALGGSLSTARNAEEWETSVQTFLELGGAKQIADLFGDYSPENVARAAQLAITPSKRADLAGQAATRAQSAHSPIYREWQDYQTSGGTLDFNAYQTMDANRRRAVTHINTGQASDADLDEAISGMIEGTLPPMLPGRASPQYTKMLAAAHRRGFDLAGAATDWTATQKHIATMNGAQQLRLNQAVNALPEMLDNVESLAKQWNGGRFAILNRANLAAAKGGAYGTKAAAIATQLDAQIADVVADLGNVYMGGNSPTDHALQLAGKSLSAEWSEPVLREMVALAKKNVQIRRNSINSTGVAGASADNPYAPPSPPPPTAPATKNPFR